MNFNQQLAAFERTEENERSRREEEREIIESMMDICKGPHLARFDREERNRAAADMRRKEIRENQLMKGRG